MAGTGGIGRRLEPHGRQAGALTLTDAAALEGAPSKIDPSLKSGGTDGGSGLVLNTTA